MQRIFIPGFEAMNYRFACSFTSFRTSLREAKSAIAERIAVPEGYTRVKVKKNSFADWLKHLPLKPEGRAKSRRLCREPAKRAED